MVKVRVSYRVGLLLVLCLLIIVASCSVDGKLAKESLVPPVNLIPDQPGKTPSYFCTWGAQNYASTDAAFEYCVELKGHFAIAETLTEKNVFHDPGWAKYFQKARTDLYLMFDLGWEPPRALTLMASAGDLAPLSSQPENSRPAPAPPPSDFAN